MEELNQEENIIEEKKMSFKNKMMLVAIFGILLGFVIKTEAAKRVTVGFEDYKLLSSEKSYNINNLQKELERQKVVQEEQAKEADKKALENAQPPDNTTCDAGAGEICQ